MPDYFQQSLFEVISELYRAHDYSGPVESKISGPVCKLDKETFDLLTRNYKNGQYCQGVVTGFMKVKDVATADDLQKASRATHKLRRVVGKHVVITTLFPDEMDALKRVAEVSELKPAAVLEATAFLYFRAKERQGRSQEPQP